MFFALILHTQILSRAKALDGAISFLVSFDLPFECLNSGNILQFGQYHVLGVVVSPKHENWNVLMGHMGLAQLTHDVSWAVLQKQIAPLTIGSFFLKVCLLVDHFPSTSGNTQVLEKVVSFGNVISQCSLSWNILGWTSFALPSSPNAHTTKSH